MKKLYSTLSVDVVKFEAQDVITASGAVTTQEPGTETPTYLPSVAPSPTASVVPTEMPADSNAPLIARTSESTAGAGGNPGSCLHYTDAAAAA